MPMMKQDLITSSAGSANRYKDPEGRLHVRVSNLTKACVNSYLGSEIPDPDGTLKLDRQRVYKLLRDPEELQKAVPTINNIQLMYVHTGVSAADPKQSEVVGTTGSEAFWEAPYIKNSLAVWHGKAIAGVETRDQCELSASYRYRADMASGTYDGVAYDGTMRDISFNHVALVEEGRAGPDVLVGDSAYNLRGLSEMSVNRKKALLAVAETHQKTADDMRVKMAADAALKPIVAKFEKLANDAKMRAKDVKDDEEMSEDADMDEETDAEKAARLKKEKDAADKKSAKDKKMAADAAKKAKDKAKKAKDEEDDETDETDNDQDETMEDLKDQMADLKEKMADMKGANDSAIAVAANTVRASMREVEVAKEAVRPIVGRINPALAMDSASDVYKTALEMRGVKTSGMHVDAYKSIFEHAVKPSAAGPAPHFANDAAVKGGPSPFLADRLKARG